MKKNLSPSFNIFFAHVLFFSLSPFHYTSQYPKNATTGYSEKLLHMENQQALLKSLSAYHL